MVTTRYSNQQGSKPRQNFCEVQPTENIGNFYRRQHDVFGYELKLLLSELLQDFQNLNYKLQRRLSDVMMIGL